MKDRRMSGGMFSLSWKEFDHKASKSHRAYIDDTKFTDVTLACDGKRKLEAHKIILSSSSPVLEKILVGNPHQHPLIYLRKVKFSLVVAPPSEYSESFCSVAS